MQVMIQEVLDASGIGFSEESSPSQSSVSLEAPSWPTPMSDDVLFHSSLSRYFCGQGRSDSPFGTYVGAQLHKLGAALIFYTLCMWGVCVCVCLCVCVCVCVCLCVCVCVHLALITDHSLFGFSSLAERSNLNCFWVTLSLFAAEQPGIRRETTRAISTVIHGSNVLPFSP